MISWEEFRRYSMRQQINVLYEQGTFVMGIRYYGYKVNLYLFQNLYIEVFINHKFASVERIGLLDQKHSRMKFYSDQIKLPQELAQ